MRRILIAALLLCLSTAANASVVWRGDFESGDLSQWSHFEGLASRLTVVQSPVREGKYALRTEVRQGDIASNGTRNEMDWVPQQTEGMDLYYAWSTMFDLEYPKVTGFQTFTQWHQNLLTGGAPPLHFDVLVDEIRFVSSTTGYKALWSAPLVRGAWHDFVLHVKWSADASVGFVELWYDGQKVLEKTSGATLLPNTWVYLKQGLYRDNAIVPTAVLYHDGMTIATTLEEVLPPAGTPPPSQVPPSQTPPVETPPTPQTMFQHGGCTSAPVDLAALGGIVALALRIRRKRLAEPGAG